MKTDNANILLYALFRLIQKQNKLLENNAFRERSYAPEINSQPRLARYPATSQIQYYAHIFAYTVFTVYLQYIIRGAYYLWIPSSFVV